MKINRIKKKMLRITKKVQKFDKLLIQDGQERALAFRVGAYMISKFRNWNVDMEYNREGAEHQQKRKSTGEVICPDIIIHQRNKLSKKDNLLIIEVKVLNSKVSEDFGKLKDCTQTKINENRKYQYLFGVSLSFVPEVKFVWFENGFAI